MKARTILCITLLALCHPQLWPQAVTTQFPPAVDEGAGEQVVPSIPVAATAGASAFPLATFSSVAACLQADSVSSDVAASAAMIVDRIGNPPRFGGPSRLASRIMAAPAAMPASGVSSGAS